MSEELKACPFCGGPGRVDESGGYFMADCPNCACCYAQNFGTAAEAIAAWNTRTPSVEGLVEALHAADMFITNGIALGFIRMPDADVPDSAHKTPDLIRAAIASYRKTADPKEN